MCELTHEQEILITEANKEKKLQEEEEKEHKRIPINRERFRLIRKIEGREKLDGNETYREVLGKINGVNAGRRDALERGKKKANE